eukprot:GHVN01084471.1.p1 GENE.GHVN01084471.1~~GHVN01084471.1.p1  ORF type:complete len:202 (-),score=17.75 GHVN01084471.1:173-778(-)
MVFSWLLFGDRYSWSLMPSVFVVIVGVALTVWAEMEVSAFTLFITCLSCVFAALKGILTQKTQVGALGLPALDVLRVVCPFAAAELICLAWIFGEVRELSHSSPPLDRNVLLHLFFLGCVAFALNFTSFRASALLTPLTINIAGNVKQVVTSLLSIPLFGGTLAWPMLSGVLVTGAGALLYTSSSLRWRIKQGEEKVKRAK